MGPSETGQLIAIIILLCLSAFFSSSETALTTVNQIRMRTLQTMAINALHGYCM